MTKEMKRYYFENVESCGYWSVLGGVEVKDIKGEYCVVVVNAWHSNKTMHKVKLRFNNRGRVYILVSGIRLYLDECLRIGI